eukprot:scaffold7095_cov260-Pinguiococcus_pyrenoidosus.AAC.15
MSSSKFGEMNVAARTKLGASRITLTALGTLVGSNHTHGGMPRSDDSPLKPRAQCSSVRDAMFASKTRTLAASIAASRSLRNSRSRRWSTTSVSATAVMRLP